jgi:hypothetical protein
MPLEYKYIILFYMSKLSKVVNSLKTIINFKKCNTKLIVYLLCLQNIVIIALYIYKAISCKNNNYVNLKEVDKKLTGEYYVVPPSTLESYVISHDSDGNVQQTKAADQTIWHIQSCVDGYLVGKAYTIIKYKTGYISIQDNYLFGSVRTNGLVNLQFTGGTGSLNDSGPMSGLGTINMKPKHPIFNMQISNSYYAASTVGDNTIFGFDHSSYMVNHNSSKQLKDPYKFKYVSDFIAYVKDNKTELQL